MENEEDNTVSLLSNEDYNQAPLNIGAPVQSSTAAYDAREYIPQNQTQNQTQSQTQTTSGSSNRGQSFEGAAFAAPVTFPIVEVVAPATLATGYTFDAMVDGRVLTVVVVCFFR